MKKVPAEVPTADEKQDAAAGRALPVRAAAEKAPGKRIASDRYLAELHTQKAWSALPPCPAGNLHVTNRCVAAFFKQAALVQHA